MCDQNINAARDAPPLFDQLGLGAEVGEARELGTPRRTINAQAAVLDAGVFEKLGMSKVELAVLQHEVVIAADAHHFIGRSFGEPGIHIFKRGMVVVPEIAEVTAMDEQVAGRDGDLPMFLMGVCEDAEGDHGETLVSLWPGR